MGTPWNSPRSRFPEGNGSGGRSSTRTAMLLIRLRNSFGSESSASSTSRTKSSRFILSSSHCFILRFCAGVRVNSRPIFSSNLRLSAFTCPGACPAPAPACRGCRGCRGSVAQFLLFSAPPRLRGGFCLSVSIFGFSGNSCGSR